VICSKYIIRSATVPCVLFTGWIPVIFFVDILLQIFVILPAFPVIISMCIPHTIHFCQNVFLIENDFSNLLYHVSVLYWKVCRLTRFQATCWVVCWLCGILNLIPGPGLILVSLLIVWVGYYFVSSNSVSKATVKRPPGFDFRKM
jgi:hypothetical protein